MTIFFASNDLGASLFGVVQYLLETSEPVRIDHGTSIDCVDVAFWGHGHHGAEAHASDTLLEVVEEVIVKRAVHKDTFNTDAVLTHVLTVKFGSQR